MTSWERFNQTLPDKKGSYSELNIEDITDKGYEHAQKVWDVFKIKSLGEYHDLYVQSDTLLLADVLKNFRDKCIEIYELDPAHFLSTPGLTWQAYLKKTGVELELLTDIDMLLMVEKGIRGGICQATHRYAKANNKYMNNYDKSIESSYVMFLEAKNLYGWAMSQKLLMTGFNLAEKLSRFNERFMRSYNENSDRRYFFEIDVEYPKNLFNSHKDLQKVEKIVCSIEVKEKYVVHTGALKQALNQGLVLKRVRGVIQCNQRAWLKPFIDMNTKLRNGAKNEFEKDFFKLMNNFVFRKTMKNVRKHRDIKLVTTNENRNKLVSEPNYQTIKHFLENLLAIEMKRTKVKMNKPIYLGMSILDINKTLCMNFGLTILNQNMETEKLCYMDTDSFVIHIFTEDFFEDIFDDVKRWFDTSEYDENDKRSLPIGMNKTSVFSKMK